MTTDFNFRASLDQSRIMSDVTSIRSQIGMALASPTGFQSPAMGIGGGGVTDFSGGATRGFGQMMAGFANGAFLGGAGFGGTHTNSNMAYSPHYGAIQANTSLEQEMRVHKYGMPAAEEMRPPGVSSAAYFLGVEKNFINRQMEAQMGAQVAGRTAFYTGVGGLAAGEGAAILAAPVGAAVGGGLAKRFLGAGAAGAGRFVGGLAASWMAFDKASDYVGGKIQDHFAEVEQTRGIYRELGELAGAGRGLTRSQRGKLGIAAHGAAGDLKMDVQEMGDILALGRNSGMLPSSTDPTKAREQFKEFARTIEEGAQVLQTSIAGATQVIKSATAQGMTAQEGIVKAASMGGPGAFAQYNAFGSAGSSVGRGMGFTGAQGFGMFTGSIGAASGAGLSGEEMKIMGGRYGAAQFLGSAQMAAARSPLGDMQLMAASSGQALGGMMDLPGQAMAAMGGGGDFMSNMGKFMVHRNELRRGIGASGVRAMAQQQVVAGGEMIQAYMPEMSDRESQRYFAEVGLGMSNDQAKLYAGGVGRSGGGPGSGAAGQARAVLAMQEVRLGQQGVARGDGGAAATSAAAPGFGISEALTGGALGALTGGPWGAAAGAGIGLVSQNWSALGNMFGGNHPSVWANAEDKAKFYNNQENSRYSSEMAAAKQRIGYVDVSQGQMTRFLSADLGGARLDVDAIGASRLGGSTAAAFYAAGMSPVAAGAGTILSGGQYWDAEEGQKAGLGKIAARKLTKAEGRASDRMAYSAVYSQGAADRYEERTGGNLQDQIDTLRTRWRFMGEGGTVGQFAASGIVDTLEPIVAGIESSKDRGRAQKLLSSGNLSDPRLLELVRDVTSTRDLQAAPSAAAAALGGGAAAGQFVSTREKERGTWAARRLGGTWKDGDPGVFDRMEERDFWRDVSKSSLFIQGEALSSTNPSRANRMINEAIQAKRVEYGDRLEGYTVNKADVRKKGATHSGDVAAEVTEVKTGALLGAAWAGITGGDVEKIIQDADDDVKEIKRKSSVAMDIVEDKARGGRSLSGDSKKGKRGAGTISRTIGWGAQEDAMSSISRSLKHTEKKLRDLSKEK